jgi:hypothetical protein
LFINPDQRCGDFFDLKIPCLHKPSLMATASESSASLMVVGNNGTYIIGGYPMKRRMTSTAALGLGAVAALGWAGAAQAEPPA